MELQVGVKALLKNKEGKYLLVKRDPKRYPEAPAIWDIVGGRINPGTELLENLKREIKEEINLDLNDNPILIAAQDILRLTNKHIVRLTYSANIKGNPKLSEDHTDFKWFSLEELKNLENLDIYVKELLDKSMIK